MRSAWRYPGSAGADRRVLLIGAGDVYEHRVAQLEGARRRDLLAGSETVQDDDLVAKDGTADDGAKLRARLPRGIGGEDEDVVAPRTLAQGAQRADHRALPRAHRDLHAHR